MDFPSLSDFRDAISGAFLCRNKESAHPKKHYPPTVFQGTEED